MAGKSIAESQGMTHPVEESAVDRKIDAKMHKVEHGANVRSRKTSHFLGLFKDQDSEHEKKWERKEKEKEKEKDKLVEEFEDKEQALYPTDDISEQAAAGMSTRHFPA